MLRSQQGRGHASGICRLSAICSRRRCAVKGANRQSSPDLPDLATGPSPKRREWATRRAFWAVEVVEDKTSRDPFAPFANPHPSPPSKLSDKAAEGPCRRRQGRRRRSDLTQMFELGTDDPAKIFVGRRRHRHTSARGGVPGRAGTTAEHTAHRARPNSRSNRSPCVLGGSSRSTGLGPVALSGWLMTYFVITLPTNARTLTGVGGVRCTCHCSTDTSKS